MKTSRTSAQCPHDMSSLKSACWGRHQRLGQCWGLCLSGRNILRKSVLILGDSVCPAHSRPQLVHPEKEQAETKASGDLCKSRVLGVPSSHAPQQPVSSPSSHGL